MYNPGIGFNNPGMIRIKNFILVPTRNGGYKDMYNRSFTLNVNNNTINTLSDMFYQQGVVRNNKLSEYALVNNVPNIMSLSPTVDGRTNIIHGWGTQRLRFLMEVESTMSDGSTTSISYIQGFSAYYDPSISGRIDPNMSFFINSITTVNRIVEPAYNRVITRPLSCFNVISNNQGMGEYHASPETMKLIRPNDIVNDMYALHVFDSNNGNGTLVNHSNDYARNEVFTSNRTNNNPLTHFTKTINGFIAGRSEASIGHDTSNILDIASNVLAESNVMAIPFIQAMFSLTNNPNSSTFTLNDLSRLDPNLSINITANNTNTGIRNTVLDSSHTEDLFKQNLETTLATLLAEAVSSTLIDNLLSVFHFTATNITGVPVVAITNFRSFVTGIDTIPFSNRVKQHIESIIYPMITNGNMTVVDLVMSCDILGDTMVSISINTAPPVLYSFPTFADSLSSPVITTDTNKQMMSNDFSDVMDMTYANLQNY